MPKEYYQVDFYDGIVTMEGWEAVKTLAQELLHRLGLPVISIRRFVNDEYISTFYITTTP